MKKLFLILLAVSSSVFSQEEFIGTSSLALRTRTSTQASLEITGKPAEVLWTKLEVPIYEPSQFNQWAFKQGKHLRCFDRTPDNMGYACYLNVSELASGTIDEY